jgi:hypothetical protein
MSIDHVSGLSALVQWCRADPLYVDRMILLWLFTVVSHFRFGTRITNRVYNLSVLPPRQFVFLSVASPRFGLNDAPYTPFKAGPKSRRILFSIMPYTVSKMGLMLMLELTILL